MLKLLQLMPNILAAEEVHAAAEEAGKHGGGHHEVTLATLLFYLFLAIAIILVTFSMAKTGLNKRFFTKPLTKYYEQLYVFVENLCVGIIGSHGRKYMPMVMTFWLVIFVSNLISLIAPTAPTADLSFNLGMALIAVGYVQYEGIRSNGFFGHFSHFAGPKMGLALIPINGMIFIIEIISETMKNVSLSLRLYGNIDGGHRAAEAMNQLGGGIIPVGAFLLPVKLLTCVVQALIFCLLFCVYISLVTHGDDHGHDHEEAHDKKPDGQPVPA